MRPTLKYKGKKFKRILTVDLKFALVNNFRAYFSLNFFTQLVNLWKVDGKSMGQSSTDDVTKNKKVIQ